MTDSRELSLFTNSSILDYTRDTNVIITNSIAFVSCKLPCTTRFRLCRSWRERVQGGRTRSPATPKGTPPTKSVTPCYSSSPTTLPANYWLYYFQPAKLRLINNCAKKNRKSNICFPESALHNKIITPLNKTRPYDSPPPDWPQYSPYVCRVERCLSLISPGGPHNTSH